MAQNKVWTLAADGVPSDANKISEVGDLWTLRQVLDTPDTCDALDETNRWLLVETGTGTMVATAGKFHCQCLVDGDNAYIDSTLAANPWKITGNFDFQLDFSGLSDTSGHTEGKVYARIQLAPDLTSGANYATIDREMQNGGQNSYRFRVTAGSVDKLDVRVNTSDTSGKLRIVRTNTDDIAGYYWNGSAWVQIGTTVTDGFSTDTEVRITQYYYYQGDGDPGQIDIDLDNITLTTGSLTNGYYRDNPTVEYAVGDAGYADAKWTRGSFAATEGGTGSVTYDDGVGNSSPPDYVGAYVTKANLKARGTGTGRYYIVKGKLTSDGSQTCTLDALSIPYSEVYSETGLGVSMSLGGAAVDHAIRDETGTAQAITITNRHTEEFKPAPDFAGAYTLLIGGSRIDIAAKLLTFEELYVSWRQPRTFVFNEKAIHYNPSYSVGNLVYLFVHDEDGNDVCRFGGRIEQVSHVGQPGAELVRYHCVGWRVVSNDVYVCDPDLGHPHVLFNTPPTDVVNYNAARYWRTCGQIIKWLIDEHHDELVAAGVIIGDGYIQDELDLLDVVPPQILFENMTFDEAIQLVMCYEPSYAYQIRPETKTYRFTKLNGMASRTLEFGPQDVATDKLLSNLLEPSIRNRFTAIEIHGGFQQVNDIVTLDGGGLTKDWDQTLEADWTLQKAYQAGSTDSGTGRSDATSTFYDTTKSWTTDEWVNGVLQVSWDEEFWGGGVTYHHKKRVKVVDNNATAITIEGVWGSTFANKSNLAYSLESAYTEYRWVYSRWLVTDEAKRNIAPYRTTDTSDTDEYILHDDEGLPPAVLAYYVLTGGGPPEVTAWLVVSSQFEYSEGRFFTPPLYAPLSGSPNVEGDCECVSDVKLLFAYYTGTLSVRYPESGYAGTAYTVAGIERVLKIYDPAFRYITDSGQFARLAEERLDAFKDIIYEGRVPIKDLYWSLANLDRLININGLDRDGNDIVTGFESVDAVPFSIRYRFFEKITELELSSDYSQVGNSSYEEIRRRLMQNQQYFMNRWRDKELTNISSRVDRWGEGPMGYGGQAFGAVGGSNVMRVTADDESGLLAQPETGWVWLYGPYCC